MKSNSCWGGVCHEISHVGGEVGHEIKVMVRGVCHGGVRCLGAGQRHWGLPSVDMRHYGCFTERAS